MELQRWSLWHILYEALLVIIGFFIVSLCKDTEFLPFLSDRAQCAPGDLKINSSDVFTHFPASVPQHNDLLRQVCAFLNHDQSICHRWTISTSEHLSLTAIANALNACHSFKFLISFQNFSNCRPVLAKTIL